MGTKDTVFLLERQNTKDNFDHFNRCDTAVVESLAVAIQLAINETDGELKDIRRVNTIKNDAWYLVFDDIIMYTITKTIIVKEDNIK